MILTVLLVVLMIAEIALSFDKSKHYRNVNGVMATAVLWLVQIIATVVVEGFGIYLMYPAQIFMIVLAVQAVVIIAAKLLAAKKDKYVKYGIPRQYTNGLRFRLISGFYDFADNSTAIYAKPMTMYIGYVAFFCSLILAVVFGIQINRYGVSGSVFSPSYSMLGLISFLLEFSIFCNSESLWKRLNSLYEQKARCSNRREFAAARYSNVEDYKYIFVKNHVWEEPHITRATKINWRGENVNPTITYYNFADKSTSEYVEQGSNPALEAFIYKNNLKINRMYITAYNLVCDNQNVLIKTPSYVDFEPYLTALVKMKIAKTKKTVLVVSSEDKKYTTIDKLKCSFEEYFGFESIPVISTIDEYASGLKKNSEIQSEEQHRFTHLSRMASLDKRKDDREEEQPFKEADILIATPEDICESGYVDAVRRTIKDLGLIIYYDFSDCVQEQALFARIIHTVLDYDDKISTLYMSDGFFDLEQVLDNFFSRRNLYRIEVPRKPSRESYVTGWKAENTNEMQARTYADASRNIGNHIPILYDGCMHTMNDFMVVEDEYDAYAENFSNFAGDPLASRLDCHVGWTDVLGGNSVYCTVSDTYNNAAHTYRAMCGIGQVSEYINIISRPYLLRNYLMYHLRYYTQHPGVLSSYSPGVIKTSRAIAYEACVKSHISGCTTEQLLKYVNDASLSADRTPEEMLRVLADTAFGGRMEGVEITSNVYDRYFIDETSYKRIIDRSGFVEKINFVNNNKVIVRNKREYPCIIPQQKLILNGIKYTVEKVEGSRVEITDSNLREAVFVNRAVRTCEIRVNKRETYATHVQHGTNSKMMFERLVCDVDITAHGNIVFKDNYHPLSENCRFVYSEVNDKEVNNYTDINVFCIRLSNPLINRENSSKLSHLMAILLNEMMPTFFPRYSERIIVGCNGWEVDYGLNCEDVSALHIATQMNVTGGDELGDNELCLYILEDSALETGLVNVFWQDEEFRYMLKILEDYLYYQEMIRREEFCDIFSDEYKENLHLLRKVILQVINEILDVPGGVSDVQYLNSIRRSRNKFNILEYCKYFNMHCDFCGKPIVAQSGQPIKYHFYAYSGRISCQSCFNNGVSAENHHYYTIAGYEKSINDWFDKRYNDKINHSFYNYLEDAEFLADECKEHNKYIITDDFDFAELEGLSWSGTNPYSPFEVELNGESIPATRYFGSDYDDLARASYVVTDNNYPAIIIRDGLPKREYMGVLCHEMAHQWQFVNLNTTFMKINVPGNVTDEFGAGVDLSNMRIEGHAEWERIQYMKKNISWFLAKKEAEMLAARNDPYGIGYLWMKKMMRVGGDDPMIPVERTFTFILKRTLYQITDNSFALMKLYFGVDQSSASEDAADDEADINIEPVDTENE